MSVLVVEDDEASRDMLARRLARRGFRVRTARDGQQALDLALAEPPAIVIMDMSLPVLDGYEATRRLKAHAATAHVPIIGLSAHVFEHDVDRAMAAGCDAYRTKPVEFDTLVALMDRLMAGPR